MPESESEELNESEALGEAVDGGDAQINDTDIVDCSAFILE